MDIAILLNTHRNKQRPIYFMCVVGVKTKIAHVSNVFKKYLVEQSIRQFYTHISRYAHTYIPARNKSSTKLATQLIFLTVFLSHSVPVFTDNAGAAAHFIWHTRPTLLSFYALALIP